MVHLDDGRVNKQMFLWADQMASRNYRNYTFVIKDTLRQIGLAHFADTHFANNLRTFFIDVHEVLMDMHSLKWPTQINRESSESGNGRNKLRTRKLCKTDYIAEDYCKSFIPISHRSAISRLRCGVAPIRIETGRFENLEVSQRLCRFCNFVEDEIHVILHCDADNDLRNILITKASSLFPTFNNLTENDKMKFLFSHPNMTRLCAK